MRSVYIELIHKLEFEEDLENWSPKAITTWMSC